MTTLVSHEIVRFLQARGVSHVFGLCGHTNIAMLDALQKSEDIEFVNVRHEQIAAHAADGYARVTRKASVVLSHLGPGLTNAATGVANAALDSIPMVVIAGDVPSYYFGKHPHQEVNLHADGDQWEIYRPFVKRAWRVDQPHLVPEILHKAFVLAESGRPGPVLVDVPMDIFSAQIDPALTDRVLAGTHDFAKPGLDPATAERMVRTLLDAERPMVHVGGGVTIADANAELLELVRHLDLPVSHTLMGKGAVPDDYDLLLGQSGYWGTPLCNEMAREADWILALGTSFKEADSSSWYEEYTFEMPPTQLMQIDIDPQELGRNYPVQIGAVADLKPAITALLEAAKRLAPEGMRRDEVKERVAGQKTARRESLVESRTSDEWPMNPARILAETREVLPKDAYLTTDVGWNKNGVGQQYDITVPGTFITPGGFATMGFGAAAALGAKLAAPERQVVCLIGDGGFGQNPAVLATLKREKVAAVIVVMNNNAFGTIAGLEKAHYDHTFGTTFGTDGDEMWIDYAAIARAYGVEGISVTTPEEFRPAIERALALDAPVVIDVPMRNIPTPTDGHWNIHDIYSPDGGNPGHVTTD